jgi:pimeloyl-ACP methyl ester carboxylesterase
LTLLEALRSILELWSLPWHVLALASSPRGDGHPVIVLPGFATSDIHTIVLRRYLSMLGYDARSWGLGANTGFKMLGPDEERLRHLLERTYDETNRQVSLVGWSLGGIMARLLARRHPELVRRVIMIGSPFTGDPNAVAIRRLYQHVSGEVLSSNEAQRRFKRDQEQVPDVPVAAIYSRSDGITAWENCVEFETDTKHVEVAGSHMGLVHNPKVMLAIADILQAAQD